MSKVNVIVLHYNDSYDTDIAHALKNQEIVACNRYSPVPLPDDLSGTLEIKSVLSECTELREYGQGKVTCQCIIAGIRDLCNNEASHTIVIRGDMMLKRALPPLPHNECLLLHRTPTGIQDAFMAIPHDLLPHFLSALSTAKCLRDIDMEEIPHTFVNMAMRQSDTWMQQNSVFKLGSRPECPPYHEHLVEEIDGKKFIVLYDLLEERVVGKWPV